MPQEKMLFCGFGKFKAKDSGKDLFLLKFLTPVRHNTEKNSADCTLIPVFTSESVFNLFLKGHKLMEFADVKYEVNGTNVYYSIPS